MKQILFFVCLSLCCNKGFADGAALFCPPPSQKNRPVKKECPSPAENAPVNSTSSPMPPANNPQGPANNSMTTPPQMNKGGSPVNTSPQGVSDGCPMMSCPQGGNGQMMSCPPMNNGICPMNSGSPMNGYPRDGFPQGMNDGSPVMNSGGYPVNSCPQGGNGQMMSCPPMNNGICPMDSGSPMNGYPRDGFPQGMNDGSPVMINGGPINVSSPMIHDICPPNGGAPIINDGLPMMNGPFVDPGFPVVNGGYPIMGNPMASPEMGPFGLESNFVRPSGRPISYGILRRFYLGLDGGWATGFSTSPRSIHSGPVDIADTKISYGLNLQAGYHVGANVGFILCSWLRTDFSYTFLSNPVKWQSQETGTSTNSLDAQLHTHMALWNAYVHFNDFCFYCVGFSPYITAGVGASFNRLGKIAERSFTSVHFADNAGHTQCNFAGRFGIGILKPFCSVWALDVGANINYIGTVRSGRSRIIITTRQQQAIRPYSHPCNWIGTFFAGIKFRI